MFRTEALLLVPSDGESPNEFLITSETARRFHRRGRSICEEKPHEYFIADIAHMLTVANS